MKKYWSILLLLLLTACPLWAQQQTATQPISIIVNPPSSPPTQTYNTNTTLNFVPTQSPIPNMGGLNGCNTTVTPTDFFNPITRITCQTTGTNVNDHAGWGIDCGGSSEVNFMNLNDDRFWVCSANNNKTFFSWDGVNLVATQGASNIMGGSSSAPFWSFTQPYVAYFSQSLGSGQFGIFAYDFTNISNPSSTLLVNLSTTCGLPSMAQVNDGVQVSADDQNFSTFLSSTSGQDSPGSVWMVTWNRTTGCRTWNIQTGAITGNGGTSIGTSDVIPATHAHNFRMSKGGVYVRVGTNLNNGEYYWQFSTLHVIPDTSPIDPPLNGHLAIGTSHSVQNIEQCGPPIAFNHLGETISAITNILVHTPLMLCSQMPATYGPLDWHQSWPNANASDSNPIFASSFNSTNFTVSHAWENEVVAFSTNFSGITYRFAHTYNTNSPGQFFFTFIAEIGASQDGKWVAFASDWNSTLGDRSGAANCISPPNSCRGDVFMVRLPIASTTSTYTSRTDTSPAGEAIPTLCSPAPCNMTSSDLNANLTYTRVTDSTTASQGGHTNGSAEQMEWNSNNTAFYVNTTNGPTHLYKLSTSPQSTSVVPCSFVGTDCIGGLLTATATAGSGDAAFSGVSPYVLYGNIGSAVKKQDFTATVSNPASPDTVTTVADGASCAGIPTSAGGNLLTMNDNDTRFAIFFGGGQDLWTTAYIFDTVQGCRWFDMATGQVGGAWGPSGAVSFFDETGAGISFQTCSLGHNLRMSRDGRWARITDQCVVSGTTRALNMVWDIGTANVYRASYNNVAPYYTGGHLKLGWNNIWLGSDTDYLGHWYNKHTLSPQIGSPTWLVNGGQPSDSHTSWNNQTNGGLQPAIVSTFQTSAPSAARQDEVLGVSTDGSGKVFRFAHMYTRACCFNDQGIANVSRDGKWAIFTSGWGGASRYDVFLVPLR